MNATVTSKSLMNFGFLLWIITEFVFLHTIYSQLALIFFFGTVFIDALHNRLFPISKIYLIYLLFLLVCWLNIKLGYSISANDSSKLIGTLGLNFIFVFCSYYYFKNKDLSQIIDQLLIAALSISILTWVVNFSLTRSIFFREAGGINGNGMAILNAFVISFLIITEKYKQTGKKTCMFLLLFFCAISGTRKSFIILIIMIATFYCFRYPKRLPKYILFGSAALAVSLFLLLKVPFLYNAIGMRIEALIMYARGGEGDGSLLTRASFINLGMQYFRNSPVWGNGINCFKTLPGAYGTYSHNNYVELLFSVGLVGTICYYLIHCCTMIKGFKNYNQTKSMGSVISIALILSCIITDYAQVGYYDRSSIVFITLAMALIGTDMKKALIRKICWS